MKSIWGIASLLCGILYCGISLNAQNVLKATGWMPEHTFTSGIEGPAVDSEGLVLYAQMVAMAVFSLCRKDLPGIVSALGKTEICTWQIIQGIIS